MVVGLPQTIPNLHQARRARRHAGLIDGTRSKVTIFPDRPSLFPAVQKRCHRQTPARSIVRYRERREHGPVADFKLLIDVMEVYLDSAVGDIQPAPDFLVRQPFGHQSHNLALTVRQHRQHVLRNRDVTSLPGHGLIGGR